jgi:hypothetical protein
LLFFSYPANHAFAVFLSNQEFELSYDDPRKNHGFILSKLENMKSKNTQFLHHFLRIELTHIVDFQDLKAHTLHVVNNGTALLFKRPTFSTARMKHFREFKNSKGVPCPTTMDANNVMVNRAISSEWLTTTVLIKMPPGHLVSMDSEGQAQLDGKVKLKKYAQYAFEGKLEFLQKGEELKRQYVQPLVWHVCLSHLEKKVLKADDDVEEMDAAFAGTGIW